MRCIHRVSLLCNEIILIVNLRNKHSFLLVPDASKRTDI